jgi:vacuolar-type H+-ATPase subunit E/Vma4
MSAERKLEYFTEVISREVELKKRRAKHQLANDISKNIAGVISSTEEKINAREQAKRRELTRKANKEIALATNRAKAKFNSFQNSLHKKIYFEILEELKLFTQSPKYEQYLIERMNEKKSNFSVVKLCQRDMHFAAAIQKATGLTPEAVEDDYIGGFILQSGRMLADYTFITRVKKVVYGE